MLSTGLHFASETTVASNYYLELSATACGFAIRHVDYLSTDTRNTIRARAQFLVPKDAPRELPQIVAEINLTLAPLASPEERAHREGRLVGPVGLLGADRAGPAREAAAGYAVRARRALQVRGAGGDVVAIRRKRPHRTGAEARSLTAGVAGAR